MGGGALGRAGRESTDPFIGLQGRSSHPPPSSRLQPPGSSPMDDGQLVQFCDFGRRGYFGIPLHLMSLLPRRQQQIQDIDNRGGMSSGSRGAVQTGPRTTEPRSLAASQCSLAHRNVWVG